MVTWLIFAVISALLAGIHNFLIKVITERKYDISMVNVIVYFVSTIFFGFMIALKGNLAIAYTINSFSILIPIILSVIFYKEEMIYKKAFVIFLSIVSMLLFI